MLAIAGGKGGCGKTTTALGLAAALARDGGRPLVVDADCDMPNLHTMADTDRSPGVDAVADGDSIAASTHRSTVVPGVDVLPAGGASGPLDRTALRRLRRARQRVILDCPAGATDAAAAPLRHADGALVVSTDRSASLDDAAKTARMAETLGARVVGSVLTRTDGSPSGVSAREGGPVRALEPVLATIPEIAGDVLGDRVGRASYDRLATALARRNI
ncbi:cobyrinic acid ac-diamide synthase [Halosimplex carlsbadense 2-9-1]|uniref:Cobyrinic acid ac-diamide synthase n=1 Tax=Halosimplex carlsbadense 2-9-1 TaxID=797114 RepID=M0CNB9_9EURY|nr:cobyrinic acid ac-diamide synthase [Halosimplex carlsbadense 2-9-1]